MVALLGAIPCSATDGAKLREPELFGSGRTAKGWLQTRCRGGSLSRPLRSQPSPADTVRIRMSRGQATFPVGLRVVAATSALLALSWYAPNASANPPTSKQDVHQAQQAYQTAVARVSAIRDEVTQIQARLQTAIAAVEKQQQLLEQITADLLETRARIADAQARYDAILGQLNDRAVQAFMSGPASNLDWILGATSLVDLSDRR